MRVRHRVPSIFSLSMVDVLCCALGCVILLWLLNAKQNDDDAEERQKEINLLKSSSQSERLASSTQLEEAQSKQAAMQAQLIALLSDREKAASLQGRLEDQIKELLKSKQDLVIVLGKQQKESKALDKKLKASVARILVLEGEVRAGTTQLSSEKKKGGDLRLKLADLEKALRAVQTNLAVARSAEKSEKARADGLQKTIARNQSELKSLHRSLEAAEVARLKLEKSLSSRGKELAAAKVYKDRWEAAEERENYLSKQLKERQAAMALATKTLAALQRERATLKAQIDNRFAGIELTGKRVIFLVDMSGSMDMLDEDTKAPGKWQEVKDTVTRLMGSLSLEKYQIICFENKLHYPLGNAGKWIDYDAKRSIDQVKRAMANVKPSGGTNMYDGLKAAFSYRADGLDTIYLLSDGLPNQGEGLTPQQKLSLRGTARAAVLAKHIHDILKKDWNKPIAKKRVRINTIGFFYESPDLGSFLWALARSNEGNFVGMSKP